MMLLRRTIPVALSVGAAIGVLVASFQVVDGIFGNPGIVVSLWRLLFFVVRGYFLYIISCLILLFLINLALCLIFPKRMREADYLRLIEYYVGVAAFLLIVLLYFWKDQETILNILRHNKGLFPRIFFFVEIVFVVGIISFIIAGAIYQLAMRLPTGRLALYISSISWFLLLFPIIGEASLLAFAMRWHPLLQIVWLIILGFILSFIIKLLNRLTHSLIALNRRTWFGFTAFLVICFISWGGVSFLKPKPSYTPRSGDEINIVLISIDALRADHLGCYGYNSANPNFSPEEFSPYIDRFAKEGLLFERAYSTSPWTLPSVASWMTGGWPTETGGTFANRRLYKGQKSLPQALGEEGYVCAAFTANPVMSSATGLGRGFSVYWEYYEATHQSTGLLIDNIAAWVNERLGMYGLRDPGRVIIKEQLGETFEWIDTHKDEKFFLWVHLWDPHYPYTPPSPYKEDLPVIDGVEHMPQYRHLPDWRMGSAHHGYELRRHIVNLYDGEVRFSDEVTGRILAKLDELNLSEDTLVIITSDHGEEFFEHGGLDHGATLYEEVLQVPFIARLPGRIPSGKRLSDPVSLLDLHPTILDFAGVTSELPVFRGESLKEPILNGDMASAGEGQMQYPPVGADEDFDYDELFWEFNTQFQNLYEGGLTEQPEGRTIFAEDLYHFDSDLKSITIGKWKLVHSPNRFHVRYFPYNQAIVPNEGEYPAHDFIEGDELYNLADDPNELKNVVYDHPDIARYLYLRLMIIDYYNNMAASYRKTLRGEEAYFGAGLKNLTKGFGYW